MGSSLWEATGQRCPGCSWLLEDKVRVVIPGGDEMMRRYRWEESWGRSLGSQQLENRGGKG